MERLNEMEGMLTDNNLGAPASMLNVSDEKILWEELDHIINNVDLDLKQATSATDKFYLNVLLIQGKALQANLSH